ncbi:N-methyltransferase, putative [Ixodes scapularis]|uniref:N-methyltransferase, putative n=1 Tax=Ixodes scapularis TaxID=6945 RepID=B7PS37_IXOSC|nr:N-methyltransferase, putative [Ixodes scapularis]|eukprot:XP_002401882.1 N-methyltransferase, putative [Ixodes scapularis]
MSNEEIRERYVRDFRPRVSVKKLGGRTGARSFYQRELHSIFASPVSDSWRTLLEVGCGPTVANIFPATRKIRSIVLSDLVPRNIEEVEKWVEKAPDAMDLSFMSEPLAILEGYKDAKIGVEDIEERTRAAVKKVISCDVLNPSVLPEGHREAFDVVLSSLCLQSASQDETSYQRATRNVSSLIRKRGHLILCGIAGSTGYTVGDVSFSEVCLSKAMVEDALSRSGLEIKRWSSLDNPVSSESQKRWDFAFVVLAEKL